MGSAGLNEERRRQYPPLVRPTRAAQSICTRRLSSTISPGTREDGSSLTFDVVLAATLRDNGVEAFYTRNSRDFDGLGWFEVIDPTGHAG